MTDLEQYLAPFPGDPEKRFQPIKFLGKGTFGFVELCIDRENNDRLVCRKVARPVETTQSEILTLSRCKHNDIIEFYGYYTTKVDQAMIDRSIDKNGKPAIVYPIGSEMYCTLIEFGTLGDLEGYINERNSLEESILIKFLIQTNRALKYLHKNNNIHRDIKPDNILLDKYGNAKLTDFGTVFQLEQNDTHKQFTNVQGTGMYMAPEMIDPQNYAYHYNYLIDIFSLGVSIYQACNSTLGNDYFGTLAKREKKKRIPDQYSKEFNDLLMSMMNLVPAQRATSAQITEKLNEITTPKEFNAEQKEVFINSMKLLHGADGIVDKVQAQKNFQQLCREDKLENPEPVYQLAQCLLYGDGTSKDLQQAITLLRFSSRKMHAPSLKLLSFCYKNGIGVEKDLFTALELLTIAEKTDPEASFLLGYEYYNSTNSEPLKKLNSKVDVRQDYKLAFHYFSKAKDFPPSQNYLGLCYLNGHGTEKDLISAYKYFSLSAEAGYLDGMFNLAKLYLDQNANEPFYAKKAVKLLEQSANQYHLGAASKLSELYNQESIIPKDEKKAAYYSKMNSQSSSELDPIYSYAMFKSQYTKDIENNEHEAITRFTTISDQHAGASYRLGQWYHDSLNKKLVNYTESELEEIEKTATEHFEKSSNNGILDATGDYSICLLDGKGTDSNSEKAIQLLKEASEQGSWYSNYLLAQCYLQGKGVKEDKPQALKLLRQSHSEGCTEATYLLAHCLHNMEGVNLEDFSSATLEESRNLYEEAAKKGHAKAAYELGVIFSKNIEIFANKEKAFLLFQIAESKNYLPAITELGILYEEGEGVKKNCQKAISLYQKALNLGDDLAKYRLGMCYLKGVEVEKNMEKGRVLLEQASSDKIIEAKTQLGILYLKGIGGPQDSKIAASLFKEAADANDLEAKVQYAECLLNGWGVQIDRKKAQRIFIEASKLDHVEATFNLAIMYLNGIECPKKVNEAMKMLDHLVLDKAHIPSMIELAKYIVYNNSDDEVDVKKAHLLLRIASGKGDSEATNLLGFCYLKGIGVPRNPEEATVFFENAIKDGNDHAKVNLAQCYIEGIGVVQNQERGYKLLTEAPQNDPATKFRKGVCLYRGLGVELNKEEGIKLIKEAAEEEDVEALCYYGKLLKKGEDVRIDKELAYKYIESASKKKLPEALFQLGLIYESGDIPGKEKNELRAQGLFKQSSDAGNPKAQFHLGKIYLQNDRKKEGVELIEKAAKQNFIEAYSEMARIYNEGDGVEKNIDKALDYQQMADDPLYQEKKNMTMSNFNSVKKPVLKQPKHSRKKSFKDGLTSLLPWLKDNQK